MLPMTNDLRKRIKIRIKNHLDISDLIQDVDIKGEDLQYAIIKNFTRVKVDISRVNLSNAVIGEKGKVTNISGNIMRNCRFCDIRFLGRVYMRKCICDGSDFNGADCSNVEYQKTSFLNCKFCETAIRLGSSYSWGAKFSQNFFDDLAKGWAIKITKLTYEEIKEKFKNDQKMLDLWKGDNERR